jgi:predicted DNA-binding WGR domain protein
VGGTVVTMTTRTGKTASLLNHLPTPTSDRWGVVLHFENGYSDKEYRVLVVGNTTTYQWGRRGADGEVKLIDHADAAAASAAARKQWAAKEAKGYWPTTGVLALPHVTTAPRIGWSAVNILRGTYDTVVKGASSTTFAKGAQPWLCQLPPHDAPVPTRGAIAQLAPMVMAGDLLPGQYVLLGVDPCAVDTVAALCPVAVPVTSGATLADAVTIAEIAAVLISDADGSESVRTEFRRCLSAAERILA